jgi:hypothetical protein
MDMSWAPITNLIPAPPVVVAPCACWAYRVDVQLPVIHVPPAATAVVAGVAVVAAAVVGRGAATVAAEVTGTGMVVELGGAVVVGASTPAVRLWEEPQPLASVVTATIPRAASVLFTVDPR